MYVYTYINIDNNYVTIHIYNRYDRYCTTGTIIYYYHENKIIDHVYRNSLIFFRFTVIFIKLLGTTTYMSSPMHGLYKNARNSSRNMLSFG